MKRCRGVGALVGIPAKSDEPVDHHRRDLGGEAMGVDQRLHPGPGRHGDGRPRSAGEHRRRECRVRARGHAAYRVERVAGGDALLHQETQVAK